MTFFPKKSAIPFVIASALTVLLLSLGLAQSQTNTTSPPENRFLLIIENSRTMEKRTAGLTSALDQLLHSGMQGQIRPGDTIGIWTYNDELHAGEFPLRTWSVQDQPRITGSILAFVAKQPFNKQPRFDSVEPILKNSPLITVVIFSSASEPVKGTPFDNEINRTLRSWRDEQQKNRLPFIIVLRAVRGVITHYTVTPAPWQVEMPPMPVIPAQSVATKPAPKTAPAQTSSVPPLIVRGKKPEPSVLPSPQAPSVKTETPPTNPSPDLASQLAHPPLPTPPAQPAPISSQTSTIAAPTPPVTNEPAPSVTSPVIDTAKTSAAVPPQTAVNSSRPQEPSNPAPGPSLATGAHDTFVFRKRLMLFALIAICLVIAIILFRRSRASHVSLITHSIDREKE